MIRYSKKNINLKILNKITMYQMILTKSFSIDEHNYAGIAKTEIKKNTIQSKEKKNNI